MARWLVLAACLPVFASTARADEPDAISPAPPELGPPSHTPRDQAGTSDVTITDEPARPEDRRAWKLYNRAFFALGHQDEATARDALETIRAGWPQHRAARLATDRLAELDRLVIDRRRAEAAVPDSYARSELVLGAALGSLYLSHEICAGCDGDRETAAVYTLSLAAGLTAAMLVPDVKTGQAALYNSAQFWGVWNALGITGGFADDASEATLSTSLQLGGLLVGIGAWQRWHPSRGDVAVMNSSLMWTALMTEWIGMTVDADMEFSDVMIAGDIGLLAGAWLAGQVEVSRGRTLIVDVWGTIGLLAGGLFAAGIDDNQGSPAALAIGNGVGLLVGILTTQKWDAPKSSSSARIVPIKPAGTNGIGIGIAFDR